jgi:hypothetical protein
MFDDTRSAPTACGPGGDEEKPGSGWAISPRALAIGCGCLVARGEHRNRVGRTATRRSHLRTGISTSFAASNDITIDIDRSGACADCSQ